MTRRRKSFYVLALVLSVAVCMLSFAACKKDGDGAGGGNGGESASLADRLVGFSVKTEDSAEIGSYYTPEIPAVTLDGESVHVTVGVSEGNKELFLNGDGKLLVESFADKILTYTVAENGETAEKTTTLKVTDTAAPQIVANFPVGLYRDESLVIADHMRVVDLSGEKLTPVISAADENGNEITISDGEITLASDSTTKKIVLSVSAADSHNNSVSKSFDIPVRDRVKYDHPFDFDVIDTNKIVAGNTRTTVERPVVKDGKNAIKVNFVGETWEHNKYYLNVRIKLQETLTNYTKFDSIKVKVSAEKNCDIQFYGTNSQTIGRDDASVHEIVYDMQKVRDNNASVIKDGSLVLNVRMNTTNAPDPVPTGMQATLYVYDIEFSYAEKTVVNGNKLDTQEQLGLLPGEIVGATFVANGAAPAPIADISNFTPTESGKLSFSVKKNGYRATDFVVDIAVVREPLYGKLVDFDDIDMSQVKVHCSSALTEESVDLKKVSYESKEAISVTMDSQKGSNASCGIRIAKPSWFDKFDYITVTTVLQQETETEGTSDYFVNEYDSRLGTLSSAGDKVTKSCDLVLNGSTSWIVNRNDEVFIYFKKSKTDATVKAIFLITDISFGKTVEKGNKLDVAQGLGLTAEEIKSAYYTQSGGTKTQITDLANFEPKASGTLDIVVDKDGYAETDLSVSVTVNLPEGQLVNFDSIDMSQIIVRDSNTLDLKVVNYNGKQAISFRMEHGQDLDGKDMYFGIKIKRPAWFDTTDYDQVTVKALIAAEIGETDEYFFLGTGAFTSLTKPANVDDEETEIVANATLSNYYSSEFLKESSYFNFFWKLRRNNKVVNTTIYITDIQFSKTVTA